MSKEEKLENLKQELESLRKIHLSIWNDYGSELCVGDMLSKEAEIELKIMELEEDYENEIINEANNSGR